MEKNNMQNNITDRQIRNELALVDIEDSIKGVRKLINLAEQSLVQRVRESIQKEQMVKYEYIQGYDMGYYDAIENVLSLPILSTPKPKGDE